MDSRRRLRQREYDRKRRLKKRILTGKYYYRDYIDLPPGAKLVVTRGKDIPTFLRKQTQAKEANQDAAQEDADEPDEPTEGDQDELVGGKNRGRVRGEEASTAFEEVPEAAETGGEEEAEGPDKDGDRIEEDIVGRGTLEVECDPNHGEKVEDTGKKAEGKDGETEKMQQT